MKRQIFPSGRLSLALAAILFAPFAAASADEEPALALGDSVAELVRAQDVEAIRALGPEVMPELVELYRASDEEWRTTIAWMFYRLAWKSEAAKDALMQDAHTRNEGLRLQVQWALGRVSNDDSVVDVLLENLQNDPHPLFREKAACGLASDQIHLTDSQKVRLFERVIELLDSKRIETRWLAMRILETQTGQTKGFNPGASLEARLTVIAKWQRWLKEYKASQ